MVVTLSEAKGLILIRDSSSRRSGTQNDSAYQFNLLNQFTVFNYA